MIKDGPLLSTPLIQGYVKWFDDRKGFGFVVPDGGGIDVFVHYTKVQSVQGYRTLVENEPVAFEMVERDRGWCAMRVMRLNHQP